MTRPAFRRRPDGVPEILPPSTWARLAPEVRSAAGIFAPVSAAALASLALFVAIGPPFLLRSGAGALAVVLWRGRAEEEPAPPSEDGTATGDRRRGGARA